MATEPGRKPPAGAVEAVRRFNRFWTRRIGILRRGYLGTNRSLAEARVLFEIGHRDGPTAADLCGDLDIDPGYMSRILASFAADGLLERTRSAADGRRSHLGLTARGRATLSDLGRRAARGVREMLADLDPSERSRVVEALTDVRGILGDPADAGPVALRRHRPGDLGWIVHRHGALYARERGWGPRFEGLVAAAAAEFLRGHDPRRERCWIAESGGTPVGSVLLVRKDATTARLRLLLVEPRARGRGIGRLLVRECVRFARRAGYRRIELWTDAGLAAARRIYGTEGFRLVRREGREDFGAPLDGEIWERIL